MSLLNREQLMSDFLKMGIKIGDTVLVRADLGNVGRINGGADSFIDALLDVLGPEGTIVSLAFTSGAFFKMPLKGDAFTITKKSYAGALPNAMLLKAGSCRSLHPMCSFVAIGKNAEEIVANHNANSPAYEPIRKIIEHNGKCILIGCVASSPGFTTAHLAEADLGYQKKLPILPWLNSTYYIAKNGDLLLFRRRDLGLCSNSFYKFYGFYIKQQILISGYIGKAYSISAPAKDCYNIELEILSKDQKFNVCDDGECFLCNAGRWDRAHHAPIFIIRMLFKKIIRYFCK
jgi:aminoglycoside N3'-acetyltransferase